MERLHPSFLSPPSLPSLLNYVDFLVTHAESHVIAGITDSFSSYESYYMSGTSDTEYSSESGSVEAVGSYYHYDVSIASSFYLNRPRLPLLPVDITSIEVFLPHKVFLASGIL